MREIEITEDVQRQLEAELIAEDFTAFLNKFHSYQQPYDTELDYYIYSSYAEILRRELEGELPKLDFSKPHFSPSGSNKDKRELYLKIKKFKRDTEEVTPIQRRWTSIGTAIGDMLQREILLAEKHYERLTNSYPRFQFEKTEEGFPCFEDFIKTQKDMGTFTLMGTSDGLLRYLGDNGELIKVGLEIKSSQTSYNALAQKKNPKEDHICQCICYSLMYNVDYFLIAYVSTAKKSWNYTEEEMAKYPDILVYGIYITQDMKDQMISRFNEVVRAVHKDKPPRMDITKFTFNNYKAATALSLSDEEMDSLYNQVQRYKKSGVPTFVKNAVVHAYKRILEIREDSL